MSSGGDRTAAVVSSGQQHVAAAAASSYTTLTNSSILNSTTTPLNLTINQSIVLVNVKELNLKLYNEIIISWNILEETSTADWIGIYKTSKSVRAGQACVFRVRVVIASSLQLVRTARTIWTFSA